MNENRTNSQVSLPTDDGGIDILGLVVLLLFYLAVLVWGIFAARWYKKKVLNGAADNREVSMVAGRKLGKVIGIFTMTATTVGGGYINGTAESIVTSGLCWTLAPFGICLGLIIGGLVFARRMRTERYLTMFDPFQKKYGHTMVGLLYLAAICGDVFWSASVLAALGTSLSVIINMDVTVALVISAVVAIGYTMVGQVVAVAYTDIVQLVFIILGMVISLPFVMTHPATQTVYTLHHNSTHAATQTVYTTPNNWLGSIPPNSIAAWIDLLITMTLGTIPWQTYFQRVLSVKTAEYAQLLSVVAGVGALLLAIPSVIIGAVAVNTDWNQTSIPVYPLSSDNVASVLPLTLRYLTPRGVALVGLGAIAAAVMSSVDSAILSSASVFTHNIYKMLLRTKASEAELMWIQRCTVLLIGGAATLMAIYVTSIYGMFIMAADLVFVIMFPQLVCVVYVQTSNTYGSFLGFSVGLFLRLSAGESYLHLPALIKYPGYDSTTTQQMFPFRTFSMVCSLGTIVLMSAVTRWLFMSGRISQKLDFFKSFADPQEVRLCSNNDDIDVIKSNEQTGTSTDKLLSDSEQCVRFSPEGTVSAQRHSPGVSTDISCCPREDRGATHNGYTVENYSENVCKTNCGNEKNSCKNENRHIPFTEATSVSTRL